MEATGLVVAPPAILRTEKRAEAVDMPPSNRSIVKLPGYTIPLVLLTVHEDKPGHVIQAGVFAAETRHCPERVVIAAPNAPEFPVYRTLLLFVAQAGSVIPCPLLPRVIPVANVFPISIFPLPPVSRVMSFAPFDWMVRPPASPGCNVSVVPEVVNETVDCVLVPPCRVNPVALWVAVVPPTFSAFIAYGAAAIWMRGFASPSELKFILKKSESELKSTLLMFWFREFIATRKIPFFT